MILFLLSSLTQIAIAEPQHAGILGIGAATCAEFAAAYKQTPELTEAVYYTWAQGFMTGQNSIAFKNKEKVFDFEHLNQNDQKFFLRSFCDQHPLAIFVQAVLDLINRLPKRVPQSN
jgi:hypothetical protein